MRFFPRLQPCQDKLAVADSLHRPPVGLGINEVNSLRFSTFIQSQMDNRPSFHSLIQGVFQGFLRLLLRVFQATRQTFIRQQLVVSDETRVTFLGVNRPEDV